MVAATSLRLPDLLKQEATAYAEALGVSLNALCAIALRDYLDARKAKPAEATPPAVAEPVDGVRWHEPPSPPRGQLRQSKEISQVPRVGANQLCPCGSGQKYKRCHGKA